MIFLVLDVEQISVCAQLSSQDFVFRKSANRLARFVLPVWSFGYGELKQRCSKVGLTNMCIRFPTCQVWVTEQTPSFIFWSVCLPCQIEHMTCLWQMPELSQYMCRANRQHPNKIFLGIYQGIPIWRVRLLTLPAACVSLVFRMSNDSFIFQIVYISLLNFWKEIKSSFYSLSHQFTLSA